MGAIRQLRKCLACLVVLELFAGRSATLGNEPWKGPDRLGKARLGMSLAELKEAYPSLDEDRFHSETVGGDLKKTSVQVTDELVEPFGKCDVKLEFLNEKLYQAQARCAARAEELEKKLVTTYGPAQLKREEPVIWYWRDAARTLIYSREQRQISLADNSWAVVLFSRALKASATGAPAPQPTP